jgi:hypothetical protein
MPDNDEFDIEINTRVTPALHPGAVTGMEEWDEDTSGVLRQVADAFATSYNAIGAVHAARDAVKTDPTLTEAAQLMRTQEHADKLFARAAGALDKAMSNMKSGIAQLEKQLSTPMDDAAAGHYGREIRDYVRGMGDMGKRVDFVWQAIASGDMRSASALLAAPAYLTGITPEMQATLTRMFREQNSPVEAKRLRAMQAAQSLILRNGALLHEQMEKAVGAPPHQVKALREAKAKADKAFVDPGT